MAHKLFQVLSEYNLLDAKDRVDRLCKMSPEEYEQLSTSISEVIPQTKPRSRKDELSLWLPYASENVMEQIPSYLFLFEKVYLIDPLFDYCSGLSYGTHEFLSVTWPKIHASFKQHRDLPVWILKSVSDYLGIEANKQLEEGIKLAGAKKLDVIMAYYLRYKDLIDDGILIPCSDSNTYDVDDDLITIPTFINYYLSQAAKEERAAQPTPENLNEVMKELISTYVNNHVFPLIEGTRFLATSLHFKSLFPSIYASNINLGDEQNKSYLDLIVKSCADIAHDNLKLLQTIPWPRPEDELLLPLLEGIPPQELLLVREKEASVIAKYRYNTQMKLVNMRKNIGDKSYAMLIKNLQLEQKAQMLDVSIIEEQIRKKYFRKIAYQIGSATISAAGAILSASASVVNPLALVGVGIGATGITAGVAKFIETWIDYKADLDQLRDKDGYILWKMSQHKRQRGG